MWSIRFLKPLVLTLMITSISACLSDEAKLDRHYENALEYIKNNDDESAVIELRNVISLDPKHADARYQLGLLYLEKGSPPQAFHELTRAASLAPENLDANLKAAEFYFLIQNLEESRNLIEHILKLDPTYHDAIALKANLELADGKFDEAIITMKNAEDSVSESDALLIIQGRIFVAQGDYDGAEKSFRQAISVGNNNLDKHMALLMLYRQQRNMEAARNQLDEIVATFPENPRVHLLRAEQAHSDGNYDLAENELIKAIELNPEKSEYRLRLADFYRSTGKSKEIEKTLAEAHDELRDNPQITSTLATFYLENKKYEQAEILFNQLESEHPDNGETKLLEARFLLKDGKTKDALLILQSLSDDYPRWAEPSFFQGLAHFSLGGIDLAQHSVASAIDKNRTNARYHALMSKLFQTQGAYKEARDKAAIALRLDPHNVTAAILYGNSLIELKEYDKAVELYTEINQQFPGNLEVLENLATSYLRLGKLDKVETIIDEVLAIDPANYQAILWLIRIKYTNNLSDAELFIRTKIEAMPEDHRLYLLLGKVLQRQEKMTEALDAYKQAQKINPVEVQAYLDSARLLVHLGKNEDAKADYAKAIQQNPENTEGYMALAALHHADGEDNEAINYYRKILEIKENDADAANNLAWLLAESQEANLSEALRIAMIAKNQLPSDPRIADTLGWVYYKRGSFDLAIAQFHFAMQQAPDITIISYHLALAYQADGQVDMAAKTLESLLENHSEFNERDKAENLLMTLHQAQ